jgi:hypothetical protein
VQEIFFLDEISNFGVMRVLILICKARGSCCNRWIRVSIWVFGSSQSLGDKKNPSLFEKKFFCSGKLNNMI